MRKVLSFALASLLSVSVAFAANPFDELNNQLSGIVTEIAQTRLDNLAKDLGGVLGGGAFHQGQTLGFPGFDVGVHVPTLKVSQDDTIVKTSVDYIALPIAQAEIGLPYKIDLIGRYSTYADSSFVGYGLRYGIIKSCIPGMPSLSVQGLYNTLNVTAGDNKLKATTMSAQAMLSFNLPIVDPYIGAGLDQTTIEPGANTPLPQAGMKGNAQGYRVEAGINLTLFPFTYLQLGGALLNGNLNYTAGFGAKF